MGVLDFADWLETRRYKLGAVVCHWSPWGILERGLNYIFTSLDRLEKKLQ